MSFPAQARCCTDTAICRDHQPPYRYLTQRGPDSQVEHLTTRLVDLFAQISDLERRAETAEAALALVRGENAQLRAQLQRQTQGEPR